MGINSAMDRPFFIQGGAVKTSGGAKNLVKGQLAVVDQSKTTIDGAKILSSFLGIPKDKNDLVIRTGVTDIGFGRSKSNKPSASAPFSLEMIKKLKVSAPKVTEQKVDDIIVGYDGFNASSSFGFKVGDSPFRLSLELEGGALQYRGAAGDKESLHFTQEIPSCNPFDDCADCDSCDTVDCKAITLELIEKIKNRQVAAGSKVSDYVDVTPVFGGCTESTRVLIPYVYWTLSVCDTGSDEALALVAAQYDTLVSRLDRKGSTSVYQMLIPESDGTPDAYESTITSIIKGCEDCPADYSAVTGGFVYTITIEDDGADLTTTVELLAAAKLAAGTVIRAAGHNAGVGYYTAVYTSEITDAEIDTFVGTAGPRATATVALVGSVASMCEDDTVTETDWVEGDTCNATAERYSIVLPDDGCGNNVLASLQGGYADNTIYAFHGTRALTLTGTSGTANINIGGVDYLATFDTDLETTADNFITAHAAAILTATGVVVSDEGVGVLGFAGETFYLNGLSITNVTTDLAGTLAAAVAVWDGTGCQNKYETLVISNIVCDECDDVFLDSYITKAPAPFGQTEWEEETTVTTTGTCLCGIRFRGKTFLLSTDECLRDTIGFEETSTRVRVAAGYPVEIREGIGTIPEGEYPVKVFSKWEPRTHLGGNLQDIEREGRAYFLGQNYRHDLLGRIFLGETSSIEDNLVQYVQYTLEVRHDGYSGSFGQRYSDNINYHFFVEVGKEKALESLLNDLAANAGVAPVQAFA